MSTERREEQPRRQLMNGGEALGEAAIRAGLKFATGYPITPGTDLLEYVARRLPEVGGVFVSAESEVGGINFLLGAAAVGDRAMINSSSLGVSLMMEGVSYAVQRGAPIVIVNMMRGGPGNGAIGPSQADYFQATKSGPHGGCRLLVYGPWTVQEMVDITTLAFHKADKWRTPVMILADTVLGQSTETVVFGPQPDEPLPPQDWIVGEGKRKGRRENPPSMGAGFGPGGQDIAGVSGEEEIRELEKKWQRMEAEEVRYHALNVEDADIIITAFGTSARIARTAMERARSEGIRVGMIRPIALWPFPYAAVEAASLTAKAFLDVEMSLGQMIEDVRLAVKDRVPVRFYGRCGGVQPTPAEILDELRTMASEFPTANIRVWRTT